MSTGKNEIHSVIHKTDEAFLSLTTPRCVVNFMKW